jgi:hypothetical protein
MITQKSFIGESSTDEVIRGYGHIEGLLQFCKDNGLAVDFEETSAVDRLIDEVVKQSLVNLRPLFAQKPVKKQVNVFVQPDQNIVDLALQESGSVEGLIAFMKNNGYAPNDDPTIGSVVVTPGGDIVDQDVRDFYKGIEWTVSTGLVIDGTHALTADNTDITVDSTIITSDETII